MHSSRELCSSSFEVRVDGRPARLEDVFEGFGEQDRLGEVDRDVCAGILRRRSDLLRDGVPVETYRRIGLDQALRLLESPTPAWAG